MRNVNPTSALGMFNDPSSSMREIVMNITDYFDLEHQNSRPFSYAFKNAQAIFSDLLTGGKNFIRVRRARFHALPRFSTTGIDSSLTNFILGFLVPGVNAGALRPDEVSAKDRDRRATQQRTTMLTPTSVYNWIEVGTFNERVFRNAMIVPLNDLLVQNADDEALVLGTFALLNSDTGAIVNDVPIQMKVEIEVTATVPLATSFSGYIAETVEDDWLFPSFPEGTSTSLQACYLSIRGSRQSN